MTGAPGAMADITSDTWGSGSYSISISSSASSATCRLMATTLTTGCPS